MGAPMLNWMAPVKEHLGDYFVTFMHVSNVSGPQLTAGPAISLFMQL
jgi:hypothetical protein